MKEILEKEPPQEDRRKTWFYHSPIEKGAVYFVVHGPEDIFQALFPHDDYGEGKYHRNRTLHPGRKPLKLSRRFRSGGRSPLQNFRNLYFLGISKFFAGSIKQVFASVSHVIPIDAEAYLNRASRCHRMSIGRGKSLCIFPEGGRPFRGRDAAVQKGSGDSRDREELPVIPVYIDGSSKALPRGAAFIKPAKIRVIFGRPFGVNDIECEETTAVCR